VGELHTPAKKPYIRKRAMRRGEKGGTKGSKEGFAKGPEKLKHTDFRALYIVVTDGEKSGIRGYWKDFLEKFEGEGQSQTKKPPLCAQKGGKNSGQH